jgi:hypothetical protein
MGTLMLVIGVGLIFSLVIFFICEEKSLKDAKMSDMKCLITEEVNISECFEQYNTIRYMFFYIAAVFFAGILVAANVHLPYNYGLAEVLSYTFIPSLLGSLLILLIKWTYQPMIKLISSFMFGAGYIGATGLAFALMYGING